MAAAEAEGGGPAALARVGQLLAASGLGEWFPRVERRARVPNSLTTIVECYMALVRWRLVPAVSWRCGTCIIGGCSWGHQPGARHAARQPGAGRKGSPIMKAGSASNGRARTPDSSKPAPRLPPACSRL